MKAARHHSSILNLHSHTIGVRLDDPQVPDASQSVIHPLVYPYVFSWKRLRSLRTPTHPPRSATCLFPPIMPPHEVALSHASRLLPKVVRSFSNPADLTLKNVRHKLAHAVGLAEDAFNDDASKERLRSLIHQAVDVCVFLSFVFPGVRQIHLLGFLLVMNQSCVGSRKGRG